MKRMISFFLVMVMMLAVVFTASAWEIYPPSEYIIMGDVNADQKVDAKDALEILIFSVSKCTMFLPENPTPEQVLNYERYEYYKTILKTVGDVNGDERMDAQDALHILQYAVKKRDTFENTDLSGLQDLVYPEILPTTPTDVPTTPTDVPETPTDVTSTDV
ncbi:MAG: hypothetical protein IKM39_02730 [Clostridia bacterium]|nr:hypothetical protein [Clostridia bacterium]